VAWPDDPLPVRRQMHFGDRRVSCFADRPPHRPAILEVRARAFCAETLADSKVPDVITVCAEPLPRNANGKLIKSVLRERAAREAG
jgi:acyl-CoA synthetase (AMP-forming)/AMP-acid ligase II